MAFAGYLTMKNPAHQEPDLRGPGPGLAHSPFIAAQIPNVPNVEGLQVRKWEVMLTVY